LFAGERSDVAQAGRQATTIQARVNHQINVVNKFEFSAKQIAEQATQEMIKSLKPFMTDVDNELRMLSKTIEQFRETRRQAAARGV
jgi:phosphoglycerate-specific signal transduction histidine kinase